MSAPRRRHAGIIKVPASVESTSPTSMNNLGHALTVTQESETYGWTSLDANQDVDFRGMYQAELGMETCYDCSSAPSTPSSTSSSFAHFDIAEYDSGEHVDETAQVCSVHPMDPELAYPPPLGHARGRRHAGIIKVPASVESTSPGIIKVPASVESTSPAFIINLGHALTGTQESENCGWTSLDANQDVDFRGVYQLGVEISQQQSPV